MNKNPSFKDILKKGALIYNPVLVQLVGLCPVVAASTTFVQAAALSVAMCIELFVACFAASAFLRNIPRWMRVPVYFLIGIMFVCPVLYYFETYSLINISLGMKIYIPLTAINSVVAVHCEQFAVKNSVRLALYDAAASGIGVSVIFLITGAVREILGNATFAGFAVNIPVTLRGMTLPFGCLILLGFLAAGLKAFTAKYFPVREEKEEAAEATAAEEVPEINPVPTAEEFALSDLDEFLKTLGIEIPAEEDGKK